MMLTRMFLAAVALAAALAGCGGGDEPATLSPQAIASAQRVRLATTALTSAQAAELLLNAAEGAYATSFFPSHRSTMSFGPFAFRFYPETGMYIGVAIASSAQYTLNGIYVVGPGFGTLASPSFMGLVTQYLPVQIVGGTTGHTLTVTVSVNGVGSGTYTVYDVPEPPTQIDFCGALTSDAVFSQISAAGGGEMVISSCSFTGNTGTIAASVSIGGQYPTTVSYTITYTYL